MDTAALAEQVKTRRLALDQAKALYAHGHGSYDEMAAAAKAFCEAFYAYQVAKYGKAKAKRLDFRAVLR